MSSTFTRASSASCQRAFAMKKAQPLSGMRANVSSGIKHNVLSKQSPSCTSQTSVIPRATKESSSTSASAPPAAAPTTPPTSVPDADTKTVLITGGNTGIGFESAKALGSKGYAVTITCRSDEKGKAAVQRLQDLVPNGSFDYGVLNLDDLSSVRDFTKKATDDGKPIDVLLNNAGVMACPEMKTKDGFEYQLGVNHIGHFVLTSGLLPLMGDSSRSSRIVNVASTAQLFGDIRFDDPNFSSGNYNNWLAYGQSKLANVFFTFELAKRLPPSAQITCNCLHPGVVATELARYLQPEDANPLVKSLANFVNGTFLKTPEQGAATSIHVASAAEIEGFSSKYFVDSKPTVASYKAYDMKARERFWDLSCELAKEEFSVEAKLPKASAKA